MAGASQQSTFPEEWRTLLVDSPGSFFVVRVLGKVDYIDVFSSVSFIIYTQVHRYVFTVVLKYSCCFQRAVCYTAEGEGNV